MWHRCYPLRLIQMSSQLLSMPDIWHCQTIYTDFVPLINSIIVHDPVPCFSKDSGIRLVVRSYDLRYKLNSGGLDIIFRLFKCMQGYRYCLFLWIFQLDFELLLQWVLFSFFSKVYHSTSLRHVADL